MPRDTQLQLASADFSDGGRGREPRNGVIPSSWKRQIFPHILQRGTWLCHHLDLTQRNPCQTSGPQNCKTVNLYNLIYVFFYDQGSLFYKKSLPQAGVQRRLLSASLWGFIIQGFTFMAMFHLELVFMYGGRLGMWFNFFPNWIFSCSNTFCLKDSFSFELTWQLGHKAIVVHF